MTGGLAQRLELVKQQINTACQAANRHQHEVRLLPITKTVPTAVIAELVAVGGPNRVGENRIVEAATKAAELSATELSWAIVGHVQSNKANLLATFASELQSLDSVALAHRLDRRLQALGRSLDVYLQVNTSNEPQKSGIAPEAVDTLAKEVSACSALRPVGLMTIALATPDEARIRACFATLRRLRDRLREQDERWQELSMGMSGDFALAIAEGATIIRVGTALFGSRAQ